MFSILTWEITVGNILQIATILGGGMWFVAGVKNKIDLLTQAMQSLDKRLTSVEAAIGLLNQTTVELAKQEVRLDSHMQRLQRLEEALEHRK